MQARALRSSKPRDNIIEERSSMSPWRTHCMLPAVCSGCIVSRLLCLKLAKKDEVWRCEQHSSFESERWLLIVSCSTGLRKLQNQMDPKVEKMKHWSDSTLFITANRFAKTAAHTPSYWNIQENILRGRSQRYRFQQSFTVLAHALIHAIDNGC